MIKKPLTRNIWATSGIDFQAFEASPNGVLTGSKAYQTRRRSDLVYGQKPSWGSGSGCRRLPERMRVPTKMLWRETENFKMKVKRITRDKLTWFVRCIERDLKLPKSKVEYYKLLNPNKKLNYMKSTKPKYIKKAL
uniref:Uncharacterized protein n=1 Tax=Nelumbo nucifera TaxID=4432 RepID=A0A822XUR3_NELNU|nr:TPA_asm: hypothetical protein HUJ06_024008 [Nelumbo nucifera]